MVCIAIQDVSVAYESAHTVILYGNLITDDMKENHDLWGAPDMLKTQYDFKLTQTIHDGEGTESNPGRVYLVMEK